jgi:pentatricopeptide repeat protein
MSSIISKIISFFKYLYNLPFEVLLNLKKLNKFLVLFQHVNTNWLSPSILNTFFDLFLEQNLVSCKFVLTKLLKQKTAFVLDKRIFKILFNICEEKEDFDFIYFFMRNLENQEKTDNVLLWHVQKYFLKFVVKKNDFESLEKWIRKSQKLCSTKNHGKTMLGFFEETLKKAILNNDFELEKRFLDLLKEILIFPADTFYNKLIDFAAKKEKIHFSEAIYQNMLELKVMPTIVTYNTLISCYFKNGDTEKAWQIFNNIKTCSLKADNFTYTTMIKGIKMSDKPNLGLAFNLFEEYKKDNPADQIIYNCMLDVCIICGI